MLMACTDWWNVSKSERGEKLIKHRERRLAGEQPLGTGVVLDGGKAR